MLQNSKKTGLYFGSFNPIHIGHLAIANYMLEFTDLDEICFVVSPQNPLKSKDSLLANRHRYAMVQRAIEDFYRFQVSNVEFKLSLPSYTINTLAVLSEKYPHKKFALILGADNLSNFKKWKNWEMILQHYPLYVYPRPCGDGGALREHEAVTWVDAPMMEISSSFIRKAIQMKKDVRFFLPEKVHAYVEEMGFYK
ncbi:MAG: nicotinate (nicotinamide) nucleotide adenylyltransferase [Bacteroidota bacterium]